MENNREIFNSKGDLINNKIDLLRQKEEILLRTDRLESDPELKAIIDRVDFKTLKDVIFEVANRCGISHKGFSFTEKDRIVTNTKSLGQYHPGSNLIAINLENIKASSKISGIFENYIDLRTLSTLIHEETHATAKNESWGWVPAREGGNMSQAISSGYHRKRFVPRDKLKLPFEERGGMFSDFRLLNEAITEKLSREFLIKYLEKSTFADQKRIDEFLQLRNNNLDKLSYAVPIKALDKMIARMAQHTGNSEEVIWEGIVRGYYGGEKFMDPELEIFFDEIFAELSIYDLAEDEIPEQLLRYIEDPENNSIYKEYRKSSS